MYPFSMCVHCVHPLDVFGQLGLAPLCYVTRAIDSCPSFISPISYYRLSTSERITLYSAISRFLVRIAVGFQSSLAFSLFSFSCSRVSLCQLISPFRIEWPNQPIASASLTRTNHLLLRFIRRAIFTHALNYQHGLEAWISIRFLRRYHLFYAMR